MQIEMLIAEVFKVDDKFKQKTHNIDVPKKQEQNDDNLSIG